VSTMMTPEEEEEEFERNQRLYENRCYKCGGKLHRIRTQSPGPDFTDCRDYLPSIPVECEDCGTRYKRKHMFVRGSCLRAEEINDLIDQFGWPIPDYELPPLDPPPTPPPSLGEIRRARAS